MKKLKALISQTQAKTRPATQEEISELQSKVGFSLSEEYKNYLKEFGVIVYGSNETYGLGMPGDYYLNVQNAWKDLSQDDSYPDYSLPLLDIGDGHYYLYNNKTAKVMQWATPNGGLVSALDESLEEFFIKYVFEMN